MSQYITDSRRTDAHHLWGNLFLIVIHPSKINLSISFTMWDWVNIQYIWSWEKRKSAKIMKKLDIIEHFCIVSSIGNEGQMSC